MGYSGSSHVIKANGGEGNIWSSVIRPRGSSMLIILIRNTLGPQCPDAQAASLPGVLQPSGALPGKGAHVSLCLSPHLPFLQPKGLSLVSQRILSPFTFLPETLVSVQQIYPTNPLFPEADAFETKARETPGLLLLSSRSQPPPATFKGARQLLEAAGKVRPKKQSQNYMPCFVRHA